MKAQKAYSTLPTSPPWQYQRAKHPKMNTIIYWYKDLSTLAENQIMIMKNYFVRKIRLTDETTRLQFKILTRRNAKYLKKFKPNIGKLDPRLDLVKYAKGLQQVNLAKDLASLKSFLLLVPTYMALSKLMKLLLRGSFTVSSFKSSVVVFREVFKTRKLSGLRSVSIVVAKKHYQVQGIAEITVCEQDNILLNMLDKLNWFAHLKNLTLEFNGENGGGKNDVFFLEIFQKLSAIESLRSLEIHILLANLTKHSMKMKEAMLKFINLERLKLCMDFKANKHSGKIFTSLMPLPNLKSLSLRFICGSDFDFTDLSKLLSSPKALTTFKFCSALLYFNQYVPIWKALRKFKYLENLSLKQTAPWYDSSLEWAFSYSVVYDIVQGLKSLKKLTLKQIHFSQDPDDLLNLPKCLLNCSELQIAKVYLKIQEQKKKPYDFNEEFYNNFQRLSEKLKLKLIKSGLPDDVSEKLTKILSRNGNTLVNYCKPKHDIGRLKILY